MISLQALKLGTRITALAMVFWSPPAALLAQEQDPRTILASMSSAIADLDRFLITGEAYADARLPAGQLIEHSSQVTVRVRRPGYLRITSRTPENTQEIYFSEGTLTLFRAQEGYYGQNEIPPDIDTAVNYVITEFGIDAPMLDFVSTNVADNLLADAEQVDYFGLSFIRNRPHHHIGVRTPELDLQLWVSAEGQPLPGKISMISKWEAGSPRFVGFLEWDLEPDIPAGELRFVPPDGAIKIEILRDSVE